MSSSLLVCDRMANGSPIASLYAAAGKAVAAHSNGDNNREDELPKLIASREFRKTPALVLCNVKLLIHSL